MAGAPPPQAQPAPRPVGARPAVPPPNIAANAVTQPYGPGVPGGPEGQGPWAQPGPMTRPGYGPAAPPRKASRVPLIAVAGIAAVLVVGAIIFFASRSGGDDEEASNPTPVPTTVSGGLSPDDVYQALLSTPFGAGELPAGFTASDPTEGDTDADDEKFNAVGVVSVGVAGGGPSAGNAIVFTVYPTEKDARGRYDKGFQAEANVTITSTYSPSGVPSPSQGINATFTDSGKKSGVSYCIVLIGNTQVWGVSLLNNDTQKGNPDTACALAKAGVNHLKKVQSGR